MAFTSILQKGQITSGCQLCDEGSKTQWKCSDCDMLMCTLCKDNVHSKFKNFNDHRITDIKNLGPENPRANIAFGDVKCKQHDQPCCSICTTCKQLVCLKCILKTHNGHKLMDEEEYNTKKERVRDQKPRIEKNLNSLTKMKEYISKVKETEYSRYDKSKHDILAQKKLIEKHVEDLLNILDDKWQNVNLDIERRQNEVSKMEEKLLQQNTTVENLMKSKDFVQFIDETNKLERLLDDDVVQINTKYTSMPKFVPGEINEDNIGTLQIVDTSVEQDTKIEIKVVRQFISDLENIHLTEVCSDGSLWIDDTKLDLLQHIQIKGNNIQELSRLNTVVWDMAVAHSNELLISNGESTLKLISRTGGIKSSVYSVAPLTPTAVHVTKRNTVIIAAKNPGQAFPATGRRVVIMMDQKGKPLVEYELDKNKKALFTSPIGITSTSEGNIFVVDRLEYDCRGRVVVLSPTGVVISIYSGHSDINSSIQFAPNGIITTTLNNIVVVDTDTHTIHILDSEGHFITYYSTKDVGIIFPYSVAVSATGNLFIGCRAPVGNPDTFKSKLYEVKFSGF